MDFFTSADFASPDLGLYSRVRISPSRCTCALGERRGVFAELSPDDAAMPGRLGLALAGLAVLPATFGRN
jgi:hypothetical protein